MLILEWILDSGDTKDWKRTESWILIEKELKAEFWTKISEISFQVMRRK